MRYIATIKNEDKSVTVKVTNKDLSGTFVLPSFLKKVRELKGHTIQTTHMLTDFPTSDCESYENGTRRIPKAYLKSFVIPYKLPMKIAQLGYDPKKETTSELAENLKKLRLEHELPQIAVACDLGIARSTYACYETGKNEPDIYTLVKIADYYKVSLDYLVGRYSK